MEEFKCHNCKADIAIKNHTPGEITKCQNCGAEIRIPDNFPTVPERPEYDEGELVSAGNEPNFKPMSVWPRRLIGLNLIYGGILGIQGMLEILISGREIILLLTLLYSVFLAFFIWNAIVGIALIEKRPNSLMYAMIIMGIQIPVFSAPYFSGYVNSGFCLKMIYSFATNGLHLDWFLGGYMTFTIGKMDTPLMIGINFFALFLFTYLYLKNQSDKKFA